MVKEPIKKDIKTSKDKIKLNSEKIRKREKSIKTVKTGLLIMLLFLIVTYFILKVIYETGYFTITLDPEFSQKSGLIMYEKLADKEEKKILKATKVEFMDNISVKWLPENIDEMGEGSHNGDNYLAYTFYIENKGSETINYWYEILADDIIKNVDEAIRIMIYRNGERTIYSKANKTTGEPELDTEKFHSDLELVIKHRENFEPGEIDKFTIVIYLEGDDPDCVDTLIGGEMKMHMDITEEHITN